MTFTRNDVAKKFNNVKYAQINNPIYYLHLYYCSCAFNVRLVIISHHAGSQCSLSSYVLLLWVLSIIRFSSMITFIEQKILFCATSSPPPFYSVLLNGKWLKLIAGKQLCLFQLCRECFIIFCCFLSVLLLFQECYIYISKGIYE